MDDGNVVAATRKPGFHFCANADKKTQAWCGVSTEIIVYNTVVKKNRIVRFFSKIEQLVMIRMLRFQIVRSSVSLIYCRFQIACLGISWIAHG